jgi:hypothetical protein
MSTTCSLHYFLCLEESDSITCATADCAFQLAGVGVGLSIRATHGVELRGCRAVTCSPCSCGRSLRRRPVEYEHVIPVILPEREERVEVRQTRYWILSGGASGEGIECEVVSGRIKAAWSSGCLWISPERTFVQSSVFKHKWSSFLWCSDWLRTHVNLWSVNVVWIAELASLTPWVTQSVCRTWETPQHHDWNTKLCVHRN